MKIHRRLVVAVVLAGGGLVTISGATTSADSHHAATLIAANSLAPVSAPYTGATNAIRGVPGGGAPWVIGHGEVQVRANGRVHVEVEGLVIDPAAQNPKAGTNPIPNFKVTVSCLSKDATGAAVTVNVSTDPFPADVAGNAEADGMVPLPMPCFAPIVFVANGGGNGAWFATTGG
jgi:hypothetical protein